MGVASVVEEFSMAEQGQTVPPIMRRAGAKRDAPAVGAFMAFFARHVQRHPEQLDALTPEFARGIAALADGDIDSRAPIEQDRG